MAETSVAIVSDIHANLEAVLAVLDDIKSKGIEHVISLGDVVGYGPDPLACLEVASTFSGMLEGDHDHVVHDDALMRYFREGPAASVRWTRQQLHVIDNPDEYFYILRSFRRDFVLNIDNLRILMYHGSPFSPLMEYLNPPSAEYWNRLGVRYPEDAREISLKVLRCINVPCFVGHTHHPGIIIEGPSGPVFLTPQEVGFEYELNQKAIINPGSVGLPRDGNPNASYIELHGRVVKFHRIPYDVVITRNKIRQREDFGDFTDTLLERLETDY